MNAIPTTFDLIRYRSRLEAKWAYFFTAIDWPFLYEPLDLDGYIPDFILQFHKPLLVEVKPCLTYKELEFHKDKIIKSGWQHEYLIVGVAPIHGRFSYFEDSLGVLSQLCGEPPERCTSNAVFHKCERCNKYSVFHDEMGWYCYVCGAAGKEVIGDPGDAIKRVWSAACNATQWMGRKTSCVVCAEPISKGIICERCFLYGA